jgi:hypothetical protein
MSKYYAAPMFSGKAKDYALFKLMFRSYAVANKFKVALIEPLFTLPDREDDVIVSENPDPSKIEKFIDANEMAMSCLCMAFEDKSMISYVRGTFTKKWPTGLAFKVLEALDQAFLPDDHIAMSQVQAMIATVRVKATKENPQAMFTKLRKIQGEYVDSKNVTITEGMLMHQVLLGIPIRYCSDMNRALMEKDCTLSKMESLARDLHRLFYGGVLDKNMEDDGEDEIALFSGAGSNIKCIKCNKYGHKAADFGVIVKKKYCSFCKKDGHVPETCWEKPENAALKQAYHKRFQNCTRGKGKGKTETAASTVTTTKSTDMMIEICLSLVKKDVSLAFLGNMDLLYQKEFWVVDSGASKHSTSHKDSRFDIEKESGSIILGNGDRVKMSEKGSIKGVLCDRFGKETRVATLKDVSYMPGNAFNLLSVSKLIDGGWEVSGNKSGYVITKNGVELVFDIAVQTASTTLWAMYLKRSGTVVGTETAAMTIA